MDGGDVWGISLQLEPRDFCDPPTRLTLVQLHWIGDGKASSSKTNVAATEEEPTRHDQAINPAGKLIASKDDAVLWIIAAAQFDDCRSTERRIRIAASMRDMTRHLDPTV